MPAAMHLTVLLSLLTATACRGSTVSPTVTATTASYATQSLTTSSTVETSAVTPQLQTTTQTTTNLTSASPQTAEQTSLSSATLNTTVTVTQTSNETVTQNQTVPLTSESLNVTAGTSGNKTSSGNKENYNLAENPGLVAVICIFTIVFGLLLVVMMVKCVRSSRSDFERLEDVPMGKVNEASPFAQYTK
ncbi:putative LOC729966 homolog isoform X2 [Poecilia latipinna]|uniref:putative LOC729966 homolog isoform X2 n=1 Tax=Poecilia latipinna TaxID=48699 RepID=UPI00072DBA2A|nr:PREDICTED: mucin-5B-like isoform X2 [Poecilia latipinna]